MKTTIGTTLFLVIATVMYLYVQVGVIFVSGTASELGPSQRMMKKMTTTSNEAWIWFQKNCLQSQMNISPNHWSCLKIVTGCPQEIMYYTINERSFAQNETNYTHRENSFSSKQRRFSQTKGSLLQKDGHFACMCGSFSQKQFAHIEKWFSQKESICSQKQRRCQQKTNVCENSEDLWKMILAPIFEGDDSLLEEKVNHSCKKTCITVGVNVTRSMSFIGNNSDDIKMAPPLHWFSCPWLLRKMEQLYITTCIGVAVNEIERKVKKLHSIFEHLYDKIEAPGLAFYCDVEYCDQRMRDAFAIKYISEELKEIKTEMKNIMTSTWKILNHHIPEPLKKSPYLWWCDSLRTKNFNKSTETRFMLIITKMKHKFNDQARKNNVISLTLYFCLDNATLRNPTASNHYLQRPEVQNRTGETKSAVETICRHGGSHGIDITSREMICCGDQWHKGPILLKARSSIVFYSNSGKTYELCKNVGADTQMCERRNKTVSHGMKYLSLEASIKCICGENKKMLEFEISGIFMTNLSFLDRNGLRAWNNKITCPNARCRNTPNCVYTNTPGCCTKGFLIVTPDYKYSCPAAIVLTNKIRTLVSGNGLLELITTVRINECYYSVLGSTFILSHYDKSPETTGTFRLRLLVLKSYCTVLLKPYTHTAVFRVVVDERKIKCIVFPLPPPMQSSPFIITIINNIQYYYYISASNSNYQQKYLWSNNILSDVCCIHGASKCETVWLFLAKTLSSCPIPNLVGNISAQYLCGNNVMRKLNVSFSSIYDNIDLYLGLRKRLYQHCNKLNPRNMFNAKFVPTRVMDQTFSIKSDSSLSQPVIISLKCDCRKLKSPMNIKCDMRTWSTTYICPVFGNRKSLTSFYRGLGAVIRSSQRGYYHYSSWRQVNLGRVAVSRQVHRAHRSIPRCQHSLESSRDLVMLSCTLRSKLASGQSGLTQLKKSKYPLRNFINMWTRRTRKYLPFYLDFHCQDNLFRKVYILHFILSVEDTSFGIFGNISAQSALLLREKLCKGSYSRNKFISTLTEIDRELYKLKYLLMYGYDRKIQISKRIFQHERNFICYKKGCTQIFIVQKRCIENSADAAGKYALSSYKHSTDSFTARHNKDDVNVENRNAHKLTIANDLLIEVASRSRSCSSIDFLTKSNCFTNICFNESQTPSLIFSKHDSHILLDNYAPVLYELEGLHIQDNVKSNDCITVSSNMIRLLSIKSKKNSNQESMKISRFKSTVESDHEHKFSANTDTGSREHYKTKTNVENKNFLPETDIHQGSARLLRFLRSTFPLKTGVSMSEAQLAGHTDQIDLDSSDIDKRRTMEQKRKRRIQPDAVNNDAIQTVIHYHLMPSFYYKAKVRKTDVKQKDGLDEPIVNHHDRMENKIVQSRAKSCTNTERSSRKDTDRFSTRFRRSDPDLQSSRSSSRSNGKSPLESAAYFSGLEVARLVSPNRETRYDIPNRKFSVALWLWSESGQHWPVSILGVYDTCQGITSSGQWSLQLVSHDTSQDKAEVWLQFNLRTESSTFTTHATAKRRYPPNQWVHVALVYNGHGLEVYIDGARVVVTSGQQGAVFPRALAFCKEFRVGGDINSKRIFRGMIGNLLLVKRALRHTEIVEVMKNGDGSAITSNANEDLFLWETFKDDNKWDVLKGRRLKLIPTRIPKAFVDLALSVPPCGEMVCDNPDLIMSYVNNQQLRRRKVVRYRVVNVMNDDGTSPVVNDGQIMLQHHALNLAFQPYSIRFHLDVKNIKNTTLRQKLVLFGCSPDHVGDGECDVECNQTRTGNDGGDCDFFILSCDASRIGNGHCDYDCNRAYHDWDGGDCCLQGPNAHYSCYDPRSPFRGYLSIEEFKEHVSIPSDTHLNVMFASWSTDHLIGIATFPWEKEVFSVMGGTVVQPQTFGVHGQMDSLVHEFGHNFGLWHVHHGVSEMPCGDPCRETEASMVLGDFCSDTAPTPQNVHCSDPEQGSDSCDRRRLYTNTPYSNFMSYAEDSCTETFTDQQTARMHCYLDLVYFPWRVDGAPLPVPLPPRVTSSNQSSITLMWPTPYEGHRSSPRSECTLCSPHGVMTQYAVNATSLGSHGQKVPALQVIGPPDAETCKPSPQAWMPNVTKCVRSECDLELYLTWPVVPRRLTIWVTFTTVSELKAVTLILKDREPYVYRHLPIVCHTPITITTWANNVLEKVIISTGHPSIAVDAIQVISAPDCAHCLPCQPTTYRLKRSPRFPSNSGFITTTDSEFTDSTVVTGNKYSYWVETMSEVNISLSSPVLHYVHGQPFCGDGSIDGEESCDDGNLVSDDGCDVKCQVEPGFRCKESPSLCYIHDGDGLCEDFEINLSVIDCGYHTPTHYTDQWASMAVANPAFQLSKCPEHVLIGQPDPWNNCMKTMDWSKAWYPCGHKRKDDDFWIEAFIPRPVVVTEVIVHLGSDGRNGSDVIPKTMSIQLITEDGRYERIGPREMTLECVPTGTRVTVLHNLTTPFFKSKGVRLSFRSYNISIAGVRLRSYDYLDPVTLSNCGQGYVYSVQAGVCLPATCDKSMCSVYSTSHGYAECTGFTEGHVCSVRCQKGYTAKLPAPHQAVCTNGRWIETHNNTCVPVSCSKPEIALARVNCPGPTVYGASCTFKCRHPARLQGVDNTVTCKANGLWSNPVSKCVVRCDPPIGLPGTRVLTKTCRAGRQVKGTRCKLRCKKGFKVEGSTKKRRRLTKLTCSAQAKWEGRRCTAVTCPRLNPIYNGLVSCTDFNHVYSTCTMRCPGEQRFQSIHCRANGKWSYRLKPCSSFRSTRCPRLRPSLTSLTSPSLRCRANVVGAKCPCVCLTPDEEAVLVSKEKSIRSGNKASRDIIVNHVTCTGAGHWFPNPVDLKCVQSCKMEAIGDGWCDARNNQERCDYDGGDCCSSTLSDQPVKAPNSCTQACSCKDPSAVENAGKLSTTTTATGGV